MVLQRLRKGIAKYLLGLDFDEQERYIDTLEKKNKKLKERNKGFKETISSQEKQIQDLKSRLEKVQKTPNIKVTLQLYYSVTNKIRTTEFSFTFYVTMVVPSTTSIQEIHNYYQRDSALSELGSLFTPNGGWDKMKVLDSTIVGSESKDTKEDISNIGIEQEISGQSYGTRTMSNVFLREDEK